MRNLLNPALDDARLPSPSWARRRRLVVVPDRHHLDLGSPATGKPGRSNYSGTSAQETLMKHLGNAWNAIILLFLVYVVVGSTFGRSFYAAPGVALLKSILTVGVLISGIVMGVTQMLDNIKEPNKDSRVWTILTLGFGYVLASPVWYAMHPTEAPQHFHDHQQR
jgi:hypothetical protein